MTEILSAVFTIGAGLTDRLDVWVLGLMGLVIVVDFIVGIRRKLFLTFSIFQVVGLVAGYIWTYSMALQQDVSGPYAWAFVVGTWCIVAVLFHAAWAAVRLTKIAARLTPPEDI